MRFIFTILFTIFILVGCSKSPSTEEVLEVCLASTIAELPESMRTEENIQMSKAFLLGMIEQAKQEGKLEEAFSNCQKNQSVDEAASDVSLDKLVDDTKNVKDLLGDEINNENSENIDDIIDSLGD